MRTAQYRVATDGSRQGNRPRDLRTRALCALDNLGGRLIDQAVIVALELYSALLALYIPFNITTLAVNDSTDHTKQGRWVILPPPAATFKRDAGEAQNLEKSTAAVNKFFGPA